MKSRTLAYLGLTTSIGVSTVLGVAVGTMPETLLNNTRNILFMFRIFLLLVGTYGFGLWWLFADATLKDRQPGTTIMALFFLLWPIGIAAAFYKTRKPIAATLGLFGFMTGICAAMIVGLAVGGLLLAPQ